jgi:hypothetical protein
MFAVLVSGKVFVAVSISGRNLFAVLVFGGGRSIHGVGYGHARQVFPDSVSSILDWPFNHSCWDVSLHQCVLTQRPSSKGLLQGSGKSTVLL